MTRESLGSKAAADRTLRVFLDMPEALRQRPDLIDQLKGFDVLRDFDDEPTVNDRLRRFYFDCFLERSNDQYGSPLVIVRIVDLEKAEREFSSIMDSEFSISEDSLREKNLRSQLLRYRFTYRQFRKFTDGSYDLGNYAALCVPVICLGKKPLPELLHFLDSSIWNRYVNFNVDNASELGARLREIEELYRLGVFGASVAVERLAYDVNEVIHGQLPQSDGSHACWLPSSWFHSETELSRCADELVHDLPNCEAARAPVPDCALLIIDDKADAALASARPQVPTSANKRQLIWRALAKDSSEPPAAWAKTATAFQLALDIFGPNAEASKERFDVILLDYLLDAKSEATGERYMGTEVLKSFKDNKAIAHGILRKFRVFPMSSFPFAFEIKVAVAAITADDTFYDLTSGADPVCTPELFRYKLLAYVHQLYKELGQYSDQNVVDTLCEAIIAKLPPVDGEHGATSHYHGSSESKQILADLVNARVKRDILEDQKRGGSRLSARVLRETPDLASILDHFEQLLRLLTWKSKRDWPRMFEEVRSLQELMNSPDMSALSSTTARIQEAIDYLTKVVSFIRDPEQARSALSKGGQHGQGLHKATATEP